MLEITMPQIELKDATFKRLQGLANPLVDNPSTVIDRLIDHYELVHSVPELRPTPAPRNFTKFEPTNMPSLTHTKLRSASIANRQLKRPNWNELVRVALEVAYGMVGTFEKLQRITDARIVQGTKNVDGFSPLGPFGFSVQGVDSQDAFRIAFGIARNLSLPMEVFFEWRDKEGAAYPGSAGTAAWPPA